MANQTRDISNQQTQIMEETSVNDDEIQKSSDFMSDESDDGDDDEEKIDCSVAELESVNKTSKEGQEDIRCGSSCIEKETETMQPLAQNVNATRNNYSCSADGIQYFEPHYYMNDSSADAILPVIISRGKQRVIMLLKFHLNQNLDIEITFYMLFSQCLYLPVQIASIRVNLQEYFIRNGLAETNDLEFVFDENSKAVFRQKQDSPSHTEYKYNFTLENIKLQEQYYKFQRIDTRGILSINEERVQSLCSKLSLNAVSLLPTKLHIQPEIQCPVDCDIAKFLPTSFKNIALLGNFDSSFLNQQNLSWVVMVLNHHSSSDQTHQNDNFVENQNCASHGARRVCSCGNSPAIYRNEVDLTESSNVSLGNNTRENVDKKSSSLVFDVPANENSPFSNHEISCRSTIANPISNGDFEDKYDAEGEALIPVESQWTSHGDNLREKLESPDSKSNSLVLDVPGKDRPPLRSYGIPCRLSPENPNSDCDERCSEEVDALIPVKCKWTPSTLMENNKLSTLTKRNKKDRYMLFVGTFTLSCRKCLLEIQNQGVDDLGKVNLKIMNNLTDKCPLEPEIFSSEADKSLETEKAFFSRYGISYQFAENFPAEQQNSDRPKDISSLSLQVNHCLVCFSSSNNNYSCPENICVKKMHEKNMNFEKIINTSACGNFVVKVPKKVFLDLNRPIRIPFLDSQFEIHEKLKNLMCPLFQLNTKEQSSRLLVEESELEKPILHLSVYGNNFANRCLKRLCLNEELDKKLIAEEISVMTYHKAFQMSHPAMKVQELQNRAQQRKITYLKNVQFPFFSGLTEKMSRYRNSDSTTDGTEKVQTFKQSKNRIQTKQFLNSQSISSANVGLRDDISEENSRNVFSNDLIKLSSKRQWGRHESDSEIPHSLEISLKDNLALSCKSVDLTEEQDDDSVPQEIKRCQPPFDVLQRDSAYGTQSKRTSDGMNEYYESYVKSSKQNYGFSLTEQKFNENAIRCTEESDVPTVHFKHESPLEYDFCRFESDNSENVLQIDPLLAKHLVTSGLPLDAVTLKLNSGQLGTHMVSEDYDTKSASHGLVIELAMQAKFTSLDDEFKELHQSSSGGTSTGRKTGHRPTIHTSIITVDPGCYEKLAEARHTLDTQGLLYPPYARSVIAAADSHLRDFLTCMKNNRLEHHCGLVFKSEEIQSIVNEKNKFRIGHEYKILQQLGAGGHGTALLCACICNDKKSEKPFVVKKIRRDHFHEEEITIPFHHGNMYSHMVEVYGIVLEGEEVSVLMQYAEGGTLKEHRTSSEGNLQHLISPLYRVLKNLSEVHRLGIAHFDIKEENIVFTSKDDPFSATLIDWGSAKIINQTNQKYGNGTRRFYPPEMLQDRTENELDLEKHDVWTVACAFLSNINGAFVFDELWKRCKDRHQMYKQGLLAGHVINEELLKGKHRPSYLLLHLTDLLMSMLDPDVTSRASVSDALSHPVFHCCKYEATAMNELCEESTCSQDTDNNRRLVRVLVHYNKKPIYLNRLCKGYPVKELVRDVGFREKVELRVPQQDIRNGYCLLKNERNVFSIDSDCYLELRPA